MNKRKPIDYTLMYTALDSLVQTELPEVELYFEIGRAVCARPEKGAAVMAAEYLQANYPGGRGFSPRNLRRMREFYRAYADNPELRALALKLGWTQNVAILESCEGSRGARLVSPGHTGAPLDKGGAAGTDPGRGMAAIHTRRTDGFLLY